MSRKKIEFDATNQTPGRLATQIAHVLVGKHKVDFDPRIDAGDKVVVLNPAGIRFTGKKLMQKEYRHHSMHPGGMKSILAKDLMRDKPEEIIRLAVRKMLPRNKMQTNRMKRLSFKVISAS